MSSGDPNLDVLLANLNAASAAYVAAVDLTLAGQDRTAVDATVPAVQAASDALAAYKVPSPPLPPPPPAPVPPTTPLTLARIPAGKSVAEITRNADGSIVVRVLASADVANATIDHPLGTKIGADSGKPVNGVLTFSKNAAGTGPLKIAAGTQISVRGWSAAPAKQANPVLTFTV